MCALHCTGRRGLACSEKFFHKQCSGPMAPSIFARAMLLIGFVVRQMCFAAPVSIPHSCVDCCQLLVGLPVESWRLECVTTSLPHWLSKRRCANGCCPVPPPKWAGRGRQCTRAYCTACCRNVDKRLEGTAGGRHSRLPALRDVCRPAVASTAALGCGLPCGACRQLCRRGLAARLLDTAEGGRSRLHVWAHLP